MQFRLSTTLLGIALIAVLLAWHVGSQRPTDITGTWYYPTPDEIGTGYWETLTIRSDGTFTKHQQYRMSNEEFFGNYFVDDNGLVTFHVSKKISDPTNDGRNTESYRIDKSYECRCALDSNNNMIDHSIGHDAIFQTDEVRVVAPSDCYLKWHCYTSMSHEQQSDVVVQMFLEIVDPSE